MRARPAPRSSAAAPLAVALLVALLAVLPRLGPALGAYNHSPDAAEYLLIARSLARGEGFTLPIRVRFAEPGPVVHSAHGERAPLFPALLALPVALTSAEPGWPDPRLQLVNVALAALAAALAAGLTGTLAGLRGLRARPRLLAMLVGGLLLAWQPGFVRASVHLWAEPLGLVLVLAAIWPATRLLAHPPTHGPGPAPERGRREAAAWLAVGLLAALARFVRPEAAVVPIALLLLALVRGHRRGALLLLLATLLVNAIGVAATGVLAPQLELLRVTRFEAVMDPAAPPPPSARQVLSGILANAWGQLKYALVPRQGVLILPLALLALRRPRLPDTRPLLVTAAALALATIGVWSTSDPARFTIAPLALLAPLAAVEGLQAATHHARRLSAPTHRRAALALALFAWLGVLAYAGTREGRKERRAPPPIEPSREGETPPRLQDPWSHALRTGQPAVLRR